MIARLVYDIYKFLCILCIIGLFALMNSCSKRGESVNTHYKEDTEVQYWIKLIEKGEMTWHLDSLTDPVFSSSYYENMDSSFYYLNDGVLVRCHMGDSLAIRTGWQIPLTSFCVKGDTVWGINYNDNEIRQYVAGEFHSGNRVLSDAEYPPRPRIGVSPMIVNDSTISYFGNIAGETDEENPAKRPVFTRFDRRSKEFVNSICYPKIYSEFNWGGGMMRWVYAAYNPSTDSYVVSFPASHEVEMWRSGVEKVAIAYGGSREIDKIKSYLGEKHVSPSTTEVLEYIHETSYYANIFYDSWNNMYYRIAEHATGIKTPDGKPKKRISIIILDDSLNKIGETDIPGVGGAYRYASFVSQEGLMLPKDSTEDVLAYMIYRPLKQKEK